MILWAMFLWTLNFWPVYLFLAYEAVKWFIEGNYMGRALKVSTTKGEENEVRRHPSGCE